MIRILIGYNIDKGENSLLESLPSLLLVGSQGAPDVFSMYASASSFKISLACFRMIVLSTKSGTA